VSEYTSEDALLGLMLLPAECHETLSICDGGGLEADHFASPENRALYREIRALVFEMAKPTPSRGSRGQRMGPDISDVCEWLAKRGTVEACGGFSRVYTLSDHTSLDARWAVRQVRDGAARRETVTMARRLIEAAQDHSQSIEATATQAAAQLGNISADASPERVLSAGDLAGAELWSLNNPCQEEYLSTGIEPLDWALSGGLASQRLVYLAGRPGHGKTALSLAIASNMARRGDPVFILSMEMSATRTSDTGQERSGDLSSRLLSAESGVPLDALKALKSGTPYRYVPSCQDRHEDEDRHLLNQAAHRMSQWALEVDDAGGLTASQVFARIRRAKARQPGLQLVVVDYIGLIGGERGEETRATMKRVSNGLNALKKELGLCIVCLSQLNRKCEERRDKRPVKSDLRDSGELENDADHVILVQRPCKYEEWELYPRAMWVREAKGRHGQNRSKILSFDASTQRIHPTEEEADPIRAGSAPTAARGGGRGPVGADW